MIGSLQLQYNRGRQAVITNELYVLLLSIVGSAQLTYDLTQDRHHYRCFCALRPSVGKGRMAWDRKIFQPAVDVCRLTTGYHQKRDAYQKESDPDNATDAPLKIH